MNRSVSRSIPAEVNNLITHHFSDKDNFVVGVSGGPDSMALMYALREIGRDAMVVHVNYGLRGAESDADQEFVEGFSNAWGFECCSVRIPDEDRPSSNTQQWARSLRYRIFEDLQRQNKCAAILTAHHRDDQTETILRKILDGSSPETWQGMKILLPPLFRPLLSFSKQEVLDFCSEHSVPFRTDHSNEKPVYFRNAVRQSVAPVFDTFSPGWRDNLLNLQSFGKLNEMAVEWITSMTSSDSGLSAEQLSAMPQALALSVIKNFLEQHDIRDLSKGQLREVLQLLESQPGRYIGIIPGKRIVRDRLTLTLADDHPEIYEKVITLKEAEQGAHIGRWQLQIMAHGEVDKTTTSLMLSVKKLDWPVRITTWKEGDRFVPFGMKNSRKISDHLTDRKIAPSQKENTLKLTDADGTIHALLYPQVARNGEHGAISEHVCITEEDSRILTITKNNVL